MINIELLFGVLEQGFKLWNTKEGNKYRDRVIELKEEYYEELKKPENIRSQLYLDERLLDLGNLASSFISYSPNK
jgi:hypothetical protein